MEKEVGANFLSQILRDKDEAFVISFDVEVNLLQDFTNSHAPAAHALNSTQINSPPVQLRRPPGRRRRAPALPFHPQGHAALRRGVPGRA